MTAKYATTCGVCGSPVSPGEEIARSGERWAHAACAEATPAKAGAGKAGAAKAKEPAYLAGRHQVLS